VLLQAAKNTATKQQRASKIIATAAEAPPIDNQIEEPEKPVEPVMDAKAKKRAELKRKAKERDQIRENKRLRECVLMKAEEDYQHEMAAQILRIKIERERERERVACVERQKWDVQTDDVEISHDCLRATKVGGSIAYDLITSGVEAEKGTHYWELLLEDIGQGLRFFVGVARPGLEPKGEYHKSPDAWFIRVRNGQRWGDCQYSQDIAGQYQKGDRVGLLLDMETGALFFYKNGERHGPGFPAGTIDGPVVVAMLLGGENYSARLRPTGEWDNELEQVKRLGWPADWEKHKEEMTGVASINKAIERRRATELTTSMNQQACAFALQAATDARAAVSAMLEGILPIFWEHRHHGMLEAYERAVTSSESAIATREDMGKFREGCSLALISAPGAQPRSTRVRLKADPVMTGKISATGIRGVQQPQLALMDPPLLQEGTRYSIEFDAHLSPPDPTLGDVAREDDQDRAVGVDAVSMLEAGEVVLVYRMYRNDGSWTYGKVIKCSGEPDSEDEGEYSQYSDYSDEEEAKEGEEGADKFDRVVVLIDEKGALKNIPQEWSTELKQLPLRQTPRFDGGELELAGVSEYDWWCKAVAHQATLSIEAVGPSPVETHHSFTCVWTEGLEGHCTRAHDCPSDKSPKEAQWFCRELRAIYDMPPPLPSCGHCAWVDPWTRGVMASAMDGQELRFGYLLHPLDEEEQPVFKCTARGYEGKYYVGKGQKVELEWAQNKMGLVVKPMESGNMIAASVAQACCEACERIRAQIETTKRLPSGATDEVHSIFESLDLKDWAFLHWRPSRGGLAEMAGAESKAQEAVARTRHCIEQAMGAEMAHLDAKLPHAATYPPVAWSMYSDRIALNENGTTATKMMEWDMEQEGENELEHEDWELLDGDQKGAMALIGSVCGEVTEADRRARSAGWWRTADLITSGDPMLHRGRYKWAVEILCKRVTGFYVGVVRDPRRSGLSTMMNWTNDDEQSQGMQSSPDGWFIHVVTGELWGNGKMGEDKAGGFLQGDRVGVELNLSDGSLVFYKNGVKHGPGYLPGSVTGPVVVAVQMMYKGQQAKLTTVTGNRRHCDLPFPPVQKEASDKDAHTERDTNRKLGTDYHRSLGLHVLRHDAWFRTKIHWAKLGTGQSKRVTLGKGMAMCKNRTPYQGEHCDDRTGLPRLALQLEKKKIKKEQYNNGVAKLTEGRCIHCHRDKESHGSSHPRQVAFKEGGDEVPDLLVSDDELVTGRHYYELQLLELPDKEEEIVAIMKRSEGGGKIVKGSKVEANFKNKGQYCPGQIVRARMNGLFDIDYDDGARETEIDPKLIRLVQEDIGVPRYNPYIGISKLGLHAMGDYTQEKSTDAWFMSTANGGLYGNGEQGGKKFGGFEQGDTVGLLLDLEDGSLIFFKNGVQHGEGYGPGSVKATESTPVTLATQMNWTETRVRILPNIAVPTEGEQQARRDAAVREEREKDMEAAERTLMAAEEQWSHAAEEEHKVRFKTPSIRST
jgi:hypothetical protein